MRWDFNGVSNYIYVGIWQVAKVKGFPKEKTALVVHDGGNVYGMFEKWQGVCCVWSNCLWQW